MFDIRLFKFSKRNNSTKRPAAGSGSLFKCTFKQGSGLIYPSVIIDMGLNEAPDFNYAYIPDFDRYYWLTDAVNRGPVWQFNLKVDPLASWKDTIGGTLLYVLRSSAESNGNIYDTYYPATADVSFGSGSAASPWAGGSSTDISQGVFICGIVSGSASVGSISYHAISPGGFASLCGALLDDSLLENSGFDINDASLPLQKSLVDPLQYIRSCIWLPISEADISGQSQLGLKVWDWNIPAIPNTKVNMTQGYDSLTLTLTIPKHPQQARGSYLNLSPYSTYWLNFPPFGVIELDGTALKGYSVITCEVCIDFITGSGTLYIYAGSTLINRIDGRVGVNINLSQVTRDYLAAATSTVKAASSGIMDAIWGNWAGAVNEAASGIESTVRAMVPKLNTMGGNGSFSSLYGTPSLYAQFMKIADEDLEHNGRPLCAKRTPAALGGFIQVLDGDISAPASSEELGEIRGYLESGFYFE